MGDSQGALGPPQACVQQAAQAHAELGLAVRRRVERVNLRELWVGLRVVLAFVRQHAPQTMMHGTPENERRRAVMLAVRHNLPC